MFCNVVYGTLLVLHSKILYCTVLYYTILYSTVFFYYTVMYKKVLYITVMYCNVLKFTGLWRNTHYVTALNSSKQCCVIVKSDLYCVSCCSLPSGYFLYCTLLFYGLFYFAIHTKLYAIYCDTVYCDAVFRDAIFCNVLHCILLYYTILDHVRSAVMFHANVCLFHYKRWRDGAGSIIFPYVAIKLFLLETAKYTFYTNTKYSFYTSTNTHSTQIQHTHSTQIQHTHSTQIKNTHSTHIKKYRFYTL